MMMPAMDDVMVVDREIRPVTALLHERDLHRPQRRNVGNRRPGNATEQHAGKDVDHGENPALDVAHQR